MQPLNDNRVTARVPNAVKETLEQAATMSGMSLNQFIVQASLKAAREAIRDEQSLRMTPRDVSALFDYLDNPPGPNDKLRAAAARHRAMTRQN